MVSPLSILSHVLHVLPFLLSIDLYFFTSLVLSSPDFYVSLSTVQPHMSLSSFITHMLPITVQPYAHLFHASMQPYTASSFLYINSVDY